MIEAIIGWYDSQTWVELAGWAGMVLVPLHVWMLGNVSASWRIAGFICGLASCVAWGLFAWFTDSDSLLVLQFIMTAIILRGIWNVWRHNRPDNLDRRLDRLDKMEKPKRGFIIKDS